MPSDNPKVVILLATLNGEEYLAEQLQSFRDQSHTNWELLVSDDGSVDRTAEIVSAFANQVPQRVTVQQGPGKGFWQNFLSLVRNKGSDGEFFAYSDQDDVWFPTKLQKAVGWLAGLPDDVPALYFTRTALVGKNGKLLGFSPLFARTPSFQNALVQNIGGGNTMVFNRAARSMLAAAPPDIELIAHDWWTYQMVTGVGGVTRYDPWPSVKYRQHEHNLVGSNVGMRQRTLRLRAFAKGRVVTWNDTNIAALNKMRHLLTPSSVATLDQFAEARKTQLPKRLYLLWKAGAYRQSVLDNIGIVVGSLLGRV
jgi:glycosyltransferase involved in cell wall biosynthesis